MVIFVSDIYGVTPWLLTLVSELGLESRQFVIADPYLGQSRSFINEQQAYQAFHSVGGIEQYIARLETIFNKLVKSHKNLLIIGFSAGAAASYKAANCLSIDTKVSCVLFYPGQIRHYLEDKCLHPTTVVFPQSEPHFELTPVADSLAQQSQVNVIKTPFQHGFMNRLSLGYDAKGYRQYTAYLANILQKHSI